MHDIFTLHHRFQMRPSIQPSGMYGEAARPFTQTWNQNGEKCPDNTIPIRRTKEEDVMRATSVATFGKKTHGSHHPRLAGVTDGHHVPPSSHITTSLSS